LLICLIEHLPIHFLIEGCVGGKIWDPNISTLFFKVDCYRIPGWKSLHLRILKAWLPLSYFQRCYRKIWCHSVLCMWGASFSLELFSFFLIFILFICAYNVWVISPLLPPLTPRYQAETLLPLSLILLKREYKQ
jgi:hypothetical protein